MPRIDDSTKQQRLERIYLLLTRNSRGLTEAEIADEVRLERRTVNNYLRELDFQGKAFKYGIYWFPLILKESKLRSFDLSPEEAVTLYLGARLLSKQQDKRNEPAETALFKLASVLKADAGVGAEIEQAARELAQRPVQENYQPIFRDVVRGYIYRKKIEIAYRPLNWNKAFQTVFSTYLLEPSPIGFTTYLIGHSSIVNKWRAYKLERIESVRLTKEDYSIPPEFPGLDILHNAWSIVMGEETVRVVLRFSEGVKARVLETRWHPSQQTREDPEKPGSLLWEVQVADTLDLLPWIRSWGADCEVIEPKELREALAKEVKRMARVYGVGNISEPQTRFFAHRREGEDRENWQPLIEHLTKTAEMARDFGADANVAELAYIAGLIHDLGKYSDAFQKRLAGEGPRVDHSTAGAKELKALLEGSPQQVFAQLLVYPIMGHHTGLPDYGNETDLEGGTVCARLKNNLPPYHEYKSELDLSALPFPQRLSIQPLRLRHAPDKPAKDYVNFSFSFLARMIYSALVDADFQETETYMKGAKPRGGHDDIPALRDKLDAHLKQFENPTSDINRKRNEILQACIAKGKSEKPGFFSLTVPTGGGKTLASMAFALHHAAAHGLKRVIYVIPFTTIIEQNAGVFKGFLGEENVLEHHSNFDWEGKKRENPDDRTNSALAKLKLAAENWDIPIVVTTNVQFFESLFANRSSRCRKLHNIAKSVIIFDEAQMLPRDYMRPAMSAVWELVTNYGASAVFCTATQPGLERFLPEKTEVRELAPNPQELFDFYKRVEVKHLGTLTDEDLLARLNAHEQALCIVNTRRHASGLFGMLEGEGKFHLSTLMCPIHRRAKLEEIKARLASGKPCRVVSTTVMEAGIDLDFPVGYRALTGLDSINQAAGRVNREMRRGMSEMFVFEPKSEFIKRTPSFLKQTAEVARMVLRDHAEAPISIPAIQAFFERLYDLQDPNISFDVKRIMECFEDEKFKFETAARAFQIIEDPTETVIIPYDEAAKRLIEELKYTQYPFSTLRKLQPYTVSIFEGEFDKLSSKGVILTIDDTYHFLNPDSMQEYYDPERGLLVPESGGGDGLFS